MEPCEGGMQVDLSVRRY